MKIKKLAIFLSVILTSCEVKHPPIYTVGDVYTMYPTMEINIDKGSIRLDSAKYIKKEGDTCNIALTYTFFPVDSYVLDYNKLLISDRGKKSYTEIEMNIEKNGDDIFKSKIYKERQYIFYFKFPNSPYFENLDNRDKDSWGWGIMCEIEEAIFNIFTGILYDESKYQ